MKAVLVIDIPDESLDGWFVDHLEINKYNTKNTPDFYEFVDGIEYQEEDIHLKPMPEKKVLQDVTQIDQIIESESFLDTLNNKITARIYLNASYLEATGYNACIDEILGE